MAEPGDDDAAMRARLDQLSQKLDTRRSEAVAQAGKASGGGDSGAAMSKGLRAASELVAGIVVGGLIGFGLDHWLGTKPWFSIIFFILGATAGFWNIIRDATKPTPMA